MLKIQWIAYYNKYQNNVTCTTIDKPKALDSYDVNVLDLSHSSIWQYSGSDPKSIDCLQDLINFCDMLNNSKNTNIVVVLPQNLSYYYYLIGSHHNRSFELKNSLKFVYKILESGIGLPYISLGYENNDTDIQNKKYTSSFYFKEFQGEILTKSKDSAKPTTIKSSNFYITTLDINNIDDLLPFLVQCKLVGINEEIPQWLKTYEFNDDVNLLEQKAKKEEIVTQATNEIGKINEKIALNEYYKRILIETGDSLVEIVFRMLNEIFSINLFEFVDVKGPDFIFKYNETTFIGEIKGINTNVKKANISQLDDHYCNYIDDKSEEEIKKVKQILIINHQRLSPLDSRQPVAKAEIDKAFNNDALIIESLTLLKIYEAFLRKQIDANEIYLLFLNSGILKYK